MEQSFIYIFITTYKNCCHYAFFHLFTLRFLLFHSFTFTTPHTLSTSKMYGLVEVGFHSEALEPGTTLLSPNFKKENQSCSNGYLFCDDKAICQLLRIYGINRRYTHYFSVEEPLEDFVWCPIPEFSHLKLGLSKQLVATTKAIPLTLGSWWSDPTFCMDMVQKDGTTLQHCQNIDLELCRAAVTETPHAMQFVPTEYCSEFILSVPEEEKRVKMIFHPNPTIIAKMIIIRAGLDTSYTHYFSKARLSDSSTTMPISIRFRGRVISSGFAVSVYEGIWWTNLSFCQAMVQKNGLMLQHCKRTDGFLYDLALAENGHAIQFILEPTIDMVKQAIYQRFYDVTVYEQLPTYWKTMDEVILFAIGCNWKNITCVPSDCVKLDHYLAAVAMNSWAFLKVPSEYQFNDEIRRIALLTNGCLLAYMHNPTEEQVSLAVHENGLALEWVPLHMKTKCIVLSAIQNTSTAFHWIPEEFKLDNQILEEIHCSHKKRRMNNSTLSECASALVF